MLATQTVAPAGFGAPQGVLMQWAGGMSHTEPLYTGPSPPLTTHEIAARCRNCVFFAKVPPSVLEPELERLFARCGTVVGINLYRPWALAKTSKGCGIVEYTSQEAAAAAVRQLNGLRHWARAPYPLVVEPLDSRRPVVLPSVLQSRQHVLGGYSSTLAAAGAPQQAYYGLVPQQQMGQQAQLFPQQQGQQVVMQAPQQRQQQQQGGLVYRYLPAGGAEGAGSYGMQTYTDRPMMAAAMNPSQMVTLQQPAVPQGVPQQQQQQQQMAAGGNGTYFYMPAPAAVGNAPVSGPVWTAAGSAGSQGGASMQMQNLVQSLNKMQLQGMQALAYVAQGAGMSRGFSAAAQAPVVPAMQLSPHAASGGGMAVPASPPQASQQQWVVPAAAMLAASSAPVATGGFAGTVLGNDSSMLQANRVAVSVVQGGATTGTDGTSPPMSGGLLAPLAASAAGGGGGAYLHNAGLSNAAAAAQMVQMTQLYAASNTLQSAAMVAPINV